MLSIRTSIIIVAFLAVCAFTWNEDIYYPPFLGPILDLIFDRDPHDPFVFGSGYTLFIDDNWYAIAACFKFLVNLFWGLLLLVSLPPLIVLAHLFARNPYSNRAHMAGAAKSTEDKRLQPTFDTRYMTLGGDGTVIWVCGVGGGFEDVISGDIEGAIARRWKRIGRRQFV